MAFPGEAARIIRALGLEPLAEEGGLFRETYRSAQRLAPEWLSGRYGSDRAICTAIYYLLTPSEVSVIHRLASDEIFHFYLGDPVKIVQLKPDGSGDVVVLGNDLEAGHRPQVIVPQGVWQGCRLMKGGRLALLGCTVSPGFEYEDFERGRREELLAAYPAFKDLIVELTREDESPAGGGVESEEGRMRRESNGRLNLRFHPLTAGQWRDFESLFGPKGACAGCWCMYWRLRRSEFNAGKGEGNRRAMQRIVRSGEIPGLLAYEGKTAVGWCSVAPRERFSALGRSRILKPVDDQSVWSVVCFYIAKPYRRMGVTVALLRAAADYARSQGAKILEGYPVEPKEGKTPDVFAYTGLSSAFREAGFEEAARRSPTRPVMRLKL